MYTKLYIFFSIVSIGLIEDVTSSQEPGVTRTTVKLSYFSSFQDLNIQEDTLDTLSG